MQRDKEKESKGTVKEESPSLWATFSKTNNSAEYYESWLALQCSMISGTSQGVLVMGGPSPEEFVPVSIWPPNSDSPESLIAISEEVIEEKCGLISELTSTDNVNVAGQPHFSIAYPIIIDGDLLGVVALDVCLSEEKKLKSAMESLQWGSCWLEILFRRMRATESSQALTGIQSSVDLLALVLTKETFESASIAFVTELATQLECDRVSLGFVNGDNIKVQAISHSSQFGERMNLVKAIGLAMDESIVQRSEVIFPPPADGNIVVTRDHEILSKQHGVESILTIPLYGNEKYYGALTLERPIETPFKEQEVELCQTLLALVAPALENKRLNDRLLIRKIGDSLLNQVKRLFGPKYVGRKFASLIILFLVIFFSIATGEYRVRADASLEGAVKRAIVAPFQGYIVDAKVRAGDVIKEGKLLCTLDDRDLRLERLSFLSQQKQLIRQRQEAQAQYKRAQVKIINAQLEQATSRLQLVESKLARTTINAPFSGLVLSGDLSQRLGGAVEQGEVLFEVAPLDAYRLILEVDERYIADLKKEQRGILVLSSLPDDKFAFVVENITPIATANEGINYFIVEANLDEISPTLRPGMEGVGKVYIEERKLIKIWTQNLINWFKLWLWSWWP